MRISNNILLISITYCLLAAILATTDQPQSLKTFVVHKGDSISFNAQELFHDRRTLKSQIKSSSQATMISPFFKSALALDAVQDCSTKDNHFINCTDFKDYGVGQVVALCPYISKTINPTVFDI